MDKTRLMELAGMQLSEGFEEDSLLSLSVKDRKILKKIVHGWLSYQGKYAPKVDAEMYAVAQKMMKQL